MPEYDDLLDTDAFGARLRSASGQNEKGFHDVIAAQVKAVATNPAMPGGWLAATGVPYNVGLGAYKAALNIIETGADLFDAAAAGGSAQEHAAAKLVGATPTPKPPSVRELFPGFFENAHAFADASTADNKVSDDIVQGVAQFALPFAGFLKLAGGLKGASTAAKLARAAAAEGVASAAAFDPEEGRVADLVKLGMESEGRFGDLLRKVAPDGSLLNQYIDYMTSRGGSRIEGRYKNAVDSLVTSAALGGILKSAAISFRTARKLTAKPIRNMTAAELDMSETDTEQLFKDSEVQ
jgi:hypothetical protein